MLCRFAFALLLAVCSSLPAAPPRPHIVFLLADDLGFNDVGWRNPQVHSPNLDALARGGAVLDHFYVQPVCSPTRAALMTGRYPFRYGLQTGVVRPWADYGLPLDELTLASALQRAGYHTAIVGKWHLGTITPEYLPTRRGFDRQYGHYNGAIDYFTHDRDGGHDWHRDDKANHDQGYSTQLIGDEALRIIEARPADKPLFLYVPFNAVHTPLQVPPSYLDRFASISDSKRRTYLAMLAAMDEQIGRIVQAVDHRGMRSQTLFIFSSDNGGPTALGGTNTPLRGAKGTLYEGGTRVTAFAHWQGVIAPAGHVQGLMHMVDWFPTLLNLAGASADGAKPLDGVDAWPMIAHAQPSARSEIVYNVEPGRAALRQGDWKLIRTAPDYVDGAESEPTPAQPAANTPGNTTGNPAAKSPGKTPGKAVGKSARKKAAQPSHELFHITQDPHETKNLADQNPAKLAELSARLDALLRQSTPAQGGPKPKDFKSPKVWGEPDAGK
jgi:arylsulfatase A-like enzyme